MSIHQMRCAARICPITTSCPCPNPILSLASNSSAFISLQSSQHTSITSPQPQTTIPSNAREDFPTLSALVKQAEK
eukprot:scaffold13970_cov125-Skeletonema_dohrnii-CCMP3373.AAC.5